MPMLACRTCGRVIDATAPLDHLLAEERRCPRCGATLNEEWGADNRRKVERRSGPTEDRATVGGLDRRAVGERRGLRRRQDDGKSLASA
jgi:phage FluMu protein Com